MRIGESHCYFDGGTELAAPINRAGRKGTGSGGDQEFDTMMLGNGPALLTQTPLMLPTMKNVHALSAALNSDLREAFREAGIAMQPPIDLRVDYNTNRIVVSGDRPDAAAIEDKLNSDPKLAEEVRTTIAISSHALGVQESLAFQREYRNSDDSNAIVAKYRHVFGESNKGEVSLRFDGSGLVGRTEELT